MHLTGFREPHSHPFQMPHRFQKRLARSLDYSLESPCHPHPPSPPHPEYVPHGLIVIKLCLQLLTRDRARVPTPHPTPPHPEYVPRGLIVIKLFADNTSFRARYSCSPTLAIHARIPLGLRAFHAWPNVCVARIPDCSPSCFILFFITVIRS